MLRRLAEPETNLCYAALRSHEGFAGCCVMVARAWSHSRNL